MWFLWLTLGMFIGTIVGFLGFCLVSMSRKRIPGRNWMPDIVDDLWRYWDNEAHRERLQRRCYLPRWRTPMSETPEILKTLARFIENCDKGEAELLSRYVNYLKSFIPEGVYYRDFYHWVKGINDGQSVGEYRSLDEKGRVGDRAGMKLRLAILVGKDPGFWEEYVPQSLTRIHEVEVDIPSLPDGWTVHRVMVCEPSGKEEIQC